MTTAVPTAPAAMPVPGGPLPASGDGPLVSFLREIDRTVDAAAVQSLLDGVTPETLSSIASSLSAITFAAGAVMALLGRRPPLPRLLPRYVVVCSAVLAAASLSGLCPMSGVVVAAPLVLHLGVALGFAPGLLIAWLRDESAAPALDPAARAILQADVVKAIDGAIRALPPERRALLQQRLGMPFSGCRAALRRAFTPAEAAETVAEIADPRRLTAPESLAALLRSRPLASAAAGLAVGGLLLAGGGWLPVLAVLVVGGAYVASAVESLSAAEDAAAG